MDLMNGIEAVIFDLDGTVIDSMWMWDRIDLEYLRMYGLVPPPDLHYAIEGMSFTETAFYFKNRFDIPDSVESIKEKWNQMAWDKYKKEVTPKKGVVSFLKYLKKNRIPTGIATSNSKELVQLILEVLDLNKYFHCVRTACEVKRGKPAPDIYELVARDLQVMPSDCLVFEDVLHGIMAGKNAGMKVCAVYDDYSKELTDEKKRFADYYVEDFTTVMKEIF